MNWQKRTLFCSYKLGMHICLFIILVRHIITGLGFRDRRNNPMNNNVIAILFDSIFVANSCFMERYVRKSNYYFRIIHTLYFTLYLYCNPAFCGVFALESFIVTNKSNTWWSTLIRQRLLSPDLLILRSVDQKWVITVITLVFCLSPKSRN